MKIALISCSKEKVNYACPAHELYSASALFSLSYQYAKKHAEKVYILSAKHGLVEENRILEPYNQTLNEMGRSEQLAWADMVLRDLKRECRIESDHFLILAGNNYSKDLLPFLPNHSLPLKGLRMGERMSRLKELLHEKPTTAPSFFDRLKSAFGSFAKPEKTPSEENIRRENVSFVIPDTDPSVPLSERLHKLFGSLPRYSWDRIEEIPFLNGIYILFEKGESYFEMDRIVRVGTHTSDNRLKVRLLDHFVRENHDGSIFRKNIGKAILNADGDPYLSTWTLDTSKPENRPWMDPEKNARTEERVSRFLRENFTFTVFQVPDKNERLRMEEAIIATLHADPVFRPSPKWWGQFSPEVEIRKSGLWLKQGLNGRPMTSEEFRRLTELCGQRNPIPATPSFNPPRPLMQERPDSSEPPSAWGQTSPSERPSIFESARSSTPASGDYRGKYQPLYDFLKRQTADQVSLTFAELEELLGFPLPNSAYTYSVWWTSSSGHTQTQSWLRAGFDTVNPGAAVRTRTITFQRK